MCLQCFGKVSTPHWYTAEGFTWQTRTMKKRRHGLNAVIDFFDSIFCRTELDERVSSNRNSSIFLECLNWSGPLPETISLSIWLYVYANKTFLVVCIAKMTTTRLFKQTIYRKQINSLRNVKLWEFGTMYNLHGNVWFRNPQRKLITSDFWIYIKMTDDHVMH